MRPCDGTEDPHAHDAHATGPTRRRAEPEPAPEPGGAPSLDPGAVREIAREWLEGSVRLPQVTAARALVELTDGVEVIQVVSDPAAFAEGRRGPRLPWGRGEAARVTRERTLRAPGGEPVGHLRVDLLTLGGGEEQLLADVLTDGLTSAMWMRLVDGDERRHGRALREVMQEGSLAAATRDALLDESLVAIGLVSLELGSLGRFTRVNHRLQRLTGRTAEQLLGSSYLDLLDPTQRVQQEAGLRRAANGRRMPFRSEGPLRPDDTGTGAGAGATVRVVTTPVLDAQDQPALATVQVEVVEAALEALAHRWEAEREEPGGLLTPAGFTEVTSEALDRARRTGEGAALYCARIEDWDRLVLRLGPEGAADVQRFVADRLRGALRSDDVLGHVRPDELAFVAEEIDPDQADLLARRLAAALRTPYEVGGRRVDLRLSLGVALAGPSTGADEALDRARRSAEQARPPSATTGAPAASVHVGPTVPADGREPTFFPARRRRSAR